MRLLNLAAFCFVITSALFLYGLNYETRRLEADVMAQERAVQKARSDISVLKAERGHLSRPERIDPLARRLGLAPPTIEQLPTSDSIADLQEPAIHARGQ